MREIWLLFLYLFWFLQVDSMGYAAKPSSDLTQPRAVFFSHHVVLTEKGWLKSEQIWQKIVDESTDLTRVEGHFESYNPQNETIELTAWILRNQQKIDVPVDFPSSYGKNTNQKPTVNTTAHSMLGVHWPELKRGDKLHIHISHTALPGTDNPGSGWQRLSPAFDIPEKSEYQIEGPQDNIFQLFDAQFMPLPVADFLKADSKRLIQLKRDRDTKSNGQVFLSYTSYKNWDDLAQVVDARLSDWLAQPLPENLRGWLGGDFNTPLATSEARKKLDMFVNQLISTLALTQTSDLWKSTLLKRNIEQIINSRQADATEMAALIVVAAKFLGLQASLAFTHSNFVALPLTHDPVFPGRYFNLALARVAIEDQIWWIDATQKLSNIGLSLPQWENRMALVIQSKNSLEKISEEKIESSLVTEIITKPLENKNAQQMLYWQASGPIAWHHHSETNGLGTKAIMNRLTQIALGFKFSDMIDIHSDNNLLSKPILTYDPLTFHWSAGFRFHHIDALLSGHRDEKEIPVLGFGELYKLVEKFGSGSAGANPHNGFWLAVKGTYRQIQVLELNSKFRLETLPENCQIESSWLEYKRFTRRVHKYRSLSGLPEIQAMVIDSTLKVIQPIISATDLESDDFSKLINQIEDCHLVKSIQLVE